ncbi:DUF4352 domain-containing protein [Gracilibacillus salinarum]|uniref:DUF4352 domain-containing protein n=1 Tax=Gracilibacillus salinarum TaxID=2932255 RepID=A0ABY4GGZ2_9BACI|nr:DUF4352 domain-containing protein [Gracilibacillus salinarum]UOQ83590.1 DUF4352 domain-containing protein [Gracilibacillus salinarum]
MKGFLKWGAIIVIGLIVLGALFDTGDGEGDGVEVTSGDADVEVKAETEDRGAEEEAESEAVKRAGVGDTATIADVSFTVNSVDTTNEISAGNEFIEPATTSGQFVMVDVTIKNDKKESITIDSSFFQLLAADGTEYDPSTDGNVMMNTDPESDFFLTQLNPGIEKSGTVVFEVGADFNVGEAALKAQTGFWGTESIEIGLE